MKVTVDGFVVEGTEEEVARLLRQLRNSNGSAPTDFDPAVLTPKQRIVFDVVLRHPNGVHTSTVAKETGLAASVVNSRLNYLVWAYPSLFSKPARGTFKFQGR